MENKTLERSPTRQIPSYPVLMKISALAQESAERARPV